MSQVTITEALAELKTIGKRLEKKKQFGLDYLMRPEHVRDPLQGDGGSAQAVARERQSISDLQERIVATRRAIQLANEGNMIAIGDRVRPIADWLVWRREIAPQHQQLLAQLRQKIDQQRNDTLRRGATLANSVESAKPGDIVVNLNEQELAKEIEEVEYILGTLDGQLSLKNATILVDVG